MRFKTNLHFHSKDDPAHCATITYNTKEGIDYAASRGFGCLALTYHHTFAWTEERADYARSKGILLIPGIELYLGGSPGVWGRHVVVLGCDKDVEEVHTFADLAEYKKTHPDAFILAPHPYFYGNFSLKKELERHIALFDGIEHSWYYSSWFNRNKKGGRVAEKYDLPFIATSDTHLLQYMDTDYALVEVREKTPEAVVDALKAGHFKNQTSPKNFWKGMLLAQGVFFLQDVAKQDVIKRYCSHKLRRKI